jgi:NDP-sugar pyrophosphorylase family protein
MKCLIYCHLDGADWTREYFSDAEPYLLRIGNKPLLEFFIEFCALNKIREIYLARSDRGQEVSSYFGDGSKWDIDLKYLDFDCVAGLEKVLESTKELVNDSLLVFDGFFFLQYKKSHMEADSLPQDKPWCNLNDSGNGLLFLPEPGKYKEKDKKLFKEFDGKHFLRAKNFASIKDFFDLNMDMVHGAARDYIMPSYNNERGVFIGQNVEIMYGCEVIKPVIMGDDIQLKRGAEIGPNAIIGSNSLIDNDTIVRNSVIYRNTYIGSKLEIDNKIIYKRRLIDPETGAMIHIVDDFLLAVVRNDLFTSVILRVIEMLLIILLFCIQLPFYILLRPWVRCSYHRVEIWRDKSGAHTVWMKKFVPEGYTKANKLFIKFSLHKFHLLPLCLLRRLRLVGSAPQPATAEALENIRELSNYRPSAFSFSDMYGSLSNEDKRQVNELFYAKHAGIGLDISIFFRTLIFNFFGNIHGKKY